MDQSLHHEEDGDPGDGKAHPPVHCAQGPPTLSRPEQLVWSLQHLGVPCSPQHGLPLNYNNALDPLRQGRRCCPIWERIRLPQAVVLAQRRLPATC